MATSLSHSTTTHTGLGVRVSCFGLGFRVTEYSETQYSDIAFIRRERETERERERFIRNNTATSHSFDDYTHKV